MEEMTGQYYILLRVEDRPGALAEIADVFGRGEVSIKSVWQEGFGDDAQLVFITHRAREGAFQAAVTRSATCRSSRRSAACSASRPRSRRGEPLARRDRGVPRPAAGHRGDARRDARRGRHAARALRVAVGRDRVRGLAEVRGREPDRLVQGPRDDGRDQQGPRGGREGGRVRLDRQHERERGGIRRQGGAHVRGARAEGQGRARQDGRDARPRRARARGRGQLRRGVRARARLAERPGHARELGEPVPAAGAEDLRVRDRRRARARADLHCVPVGNAGNISSHWIGYSDYLADGTIHEPPRLFGFQASRRGAARLGRPVEEPHTIATAIRIGNPASWDLAMAPRRRPRARSWP